MLQERSPSRFRTALAAIVAASTLVAACGEHPNEPFKARSTLYHFPSEAIVSVVSSPHRLIRLSPASEPFDLVFDSRIDGQVDSSGFPKIFSITDGPMSTKTYTPTQAGVVACRVGVSAVACGMALNVGDEQWSILFPPSFKPEIAAMAARARTYIKAAALPDDTSSANLNGRLP